MRPRQQRRPSRDIGKHDEYIFSENGSHINDVISVR